MAKELMSKEIALFDVEASTKEEIIDIIADAMEKDGRLINKNGYIMDVMIREKKSSTAIGFLVATPHAKSAHVKEVSLGFAKLKKSIIWDNGEEVKMVFQIGVPSPGQGDRHLEILASLFRRIVHDDFREKLNNVNTAEDIIELIGQV